MDVTIAERRPLDALQALRRLEKAALRPPALSADPLHPDIIAYGTRFLQTPSAALMHPWRHAHHASMQHCPLQAHGLLQVILPTEPCSPHVMCCFYAWPCGGTDAAPCSHFDVAPAELRAEVQNAQLEERQRRLAAVAESALHEAASLHAPVAEGASSELRLATGGSC